MRPFRLKAVLYATLFFTPLLTSLVIARFELSLTDRSHLIEGLSNVQTSVS